MKPKTGIYLLLISAVLTGCLTTEYNVATRKQDIFFYSTEKEINMGRNISKQVQAELPIEKTPKLNEDIFDIGRQLSDVCDRQAINYYFYVIDKDEKNAFSLPGGYIYIYKGLIDLLNNDDQIAFVLAHEIGHIVARHSIKRLQASLGYNLLLLGSSQVEASGNAPQAISLALATILSGYSQEDELLADHLAVKYTKKAGFDSTAGIKVLEKLEEASRKEGPRRISYFRTHPFIQERIKNIKQNLGVPLDFKDIIN